jgi:hypothetical protein
VEGADAVIDEATIVSKKCRCGQEYVPSTYAIRGPDDNLLPIPQVCYRCAEEDTRLNRALREAESLFEHLINQAVRFGWADTATIAFEIKTKIALLNLRRRMGTP